MIVNSPCLRAQVDESSESESRYDRLLARVGSAISIHPELVKLVSYIVLFSADFTGVKNRYRVETIQVCDEHEIFRYCRCRIHFPSQPTYKNNIEIADTR